MLGMFVGVAGRCGRAAFAAAALLCLVPVGATNAADSVAVVATPVPLAPEAPDSRELGALVYRGGLVLRSPDRRFGGLSGLHVSSDGRTLTAVTDRGHWLRAVLTYDAEGNLAGVADAEMGDLKGVDGRPLTGLRGDAEALAFLPDGSAVVGFERRHRLLIYPPSDPPFSGRPTRFTPPLGLERAPANGGLEALAHVGSRYLFAVTEKLRSSGASVAGWVGRDGKWEPFTYVRPAGFAPTGATLMPGGDVLVTERKYAPATGPVIRLVRHARAGIGPRRRLKGLEIARLGRPLTVDNIEGVSARRGPARADGTRETLVYLVSDDNFSPLQRTILLMFALREG